MRYEDKLRIKEAIKISNLLGDKIWKGFNEAPFAILLVTDSVEFLINHPKPSKDFTDAGLDNILHTNIHYRKTIFSKNFLATFPVVTGISTIVVGTPENTNKNSSSWILTLLHEHFHQLQTSKPDYYTAVNSLDLSGGDQTGMWMLNYAFPYTDSLVNDQFHKYKLALKEAVDAVNKEKLRAAFNTYYTERDKFKTLLGAKDYSYFSFQIWQEGIARYAEHKFLELLKDYTTSAEVQKLSDYISFKELAAQFHESEFGILTKSELKKEKRVCFYSVGLAEGMLLDKLQENWREKYFIEKFYIEKFH